MCLGFLILRDAISVRLKQPHCICSTEQRVLYIFLLVFLIFSHVHDWNVAENSADFFVIKSVLAGVVIVQFKVFAQRERHVGFPLCLQVFLFL